MRAWLWVAANSAQLWSALSCARSDARVTPVQQPLSHAYQQTIPVMQNKRNGRYALTKLFDTADVLATNLTAACVDASVKTSDEIWRPASTAASADSEAVGSDAPAAVRPLMQAIVQSGLHVAYAKMLAHEVRRASPAAGASVFVLQAMLFVGTVRLQVPGIARLYPDVADDRFATVRTMVDVTTAHAAAVAVPAPTASSPAVSSSSNSTEAAAVVTSAAGGGGDFDLDAALDELFD